MAKRSPYSSRKYPERSKDVFATQAMLYAVRDELKDDLKAMEHSLRSEITKQGHELRSEMSKLSSQMHRHLCLAEEQNARNIAVIDALTSLFTRQDRVEAQVDQVEKDISSFRR